MATTMNLGSRGDSFLSLLLLSLMYLNIVQAQPSPGPPQMQMCSGNGNFITVSGADLCECDPGIFGLTCSAVINCTNDHTVCDAGGTCTPGSLDTCDCVPGYAGGDCRIDIDECISNPCENGTCNNLVGSYTCTCHPGWTNTNCDHSIDDCTSNPCVNGGICADGHLSYTCTCTPRYNGTMCEDITITGVRPTVGPRSGGTPVTITGSFVVNIDFVTIGDIPCLLKERTANNYVCLSGPLTEAAQVTESLNVILYNNNTNTSIHSGFQFKYQDDPVIFKIEPLVSIVSGGALLTVTGQNLDIVETTVMVSRVRSLVNLKEYSTETNCTVKTSSEMVCLTPEIDVGRLSKRRKRRQAMKSLNITEDIEVEIAFRLDGVQAYRNLTVGNLTEYSRITIYADPDIQRFSPSVMTFTSTWPMKERYLEIKGKRLLQGLRAGAYTVRIGEVVCANIDVQENLITCEPPKTRPQVSTGDYVGDNRIPVKVLFANQAVILGYLEYIQNLWEYPPARYGIIGALCGTVVIIILIIVVCCRYKRSPPTCNNPASHGVGVPSEGLV